MFYFFKRTVSMFKNMLTRIGRVCRLRFGRSIVYQYNDFSIELPANHLLPEYQLIHPKYDKFLPHLVSYIDKSSTVIDVGANVGDTLAGMVEKNPLVNYICIEPDDLFYKYLKANVKKITGAMSDVRIQSIKALVGKGVTDVSLVGRGGTKHAVLSAGGNIKSMSMDEIVSNIQDIDVRLLKSDVDGFDYDVLDSSVSVIENHKPMLFFECHCDFDYQKDGYATTLKFLEASGYCDWVVFDNFGEIVIRTCSVDVVTQVIDYIWQQNLGKATRTIYYCDILSVQQKDSALIDKVVEEYA